MATNLSLGTGRRKTAVARVYLREGNGDIIVNGKDLDSYFSNAILSIIVKQPFEVTSIYNLFLKFSLFKLIQKLLYFYELIITSFR